ncbi:MAG: quinoprotein relay system zinc metallohydrolase 1 [Burkholderiales bacterium]|nr:quinoprotein relay system zinc metallohydrolase 1 [Burkholderiales bacterium]
MTLAVAAPDLAHFDYRLQARELSPGVYVVEGANADFSVENGCNIINTGFIVTDTGVLVVNTGPDKRYGEQLRALIARTTPKPVQEVLVLDAHPDYYLGNQAFADVPRRATPATRAAIARVAAAYETNMYRLCGDWMRGTETLAPDADAKPGRWSLGGREFELVELAGHTDSDLVLIDRTSGIAFVGGLVFVRRIPTTPTARIAPWIASLDRLEALKLPLVVESHGPIRSDAGAPQRGIDMTRRYLRWLDRQFGDWAAQGWEMNDVIHGPVPAEFRGWAAFDTEYLRNVANLYPLYERAALK